MKKILLIFLCAKLFFLFFVLEAYCEIALANRADYEFLFKKLEQVGFSRENLYEVFSDERIIVHPEILKKKGSGLSYFDPRFGLLSKESMERGRQVLREKAEIFKKVEKKYGIQKEVLVGIFRIETNLGQYQYEYKVFNALYTLWVIKNPRSDFFGKELINFIVLCKNNNLDILGVNGSWAGAFGLFQFMPSSFLNFAVDGDGDGKIDLFVFEDAVFSAANYLCLNGWKNGSIDENKKAIFAYNRCSNYVKAVLAYAKAIK